MKPFKNYEQQLELLIQRGLQIADEGEFLNLLKHQNYYRLRGYFHPYLVESEQTSEPHFKLGTTGQDIIQLIEFDRNLRNLLFEGLAIFETQFRAAMAYHAADFDPYIHLTGNGLSDDFINPKVEGEKSLYESWFDGYTSALDKHSKNDIVLWHREKYEGRIPIWASVELLDFGKISSLYRGLDEPISTSIANSFGCGGYFMKSLVATLNDLRNHVAHHSRIWNFHYPISPTGRLSKLPSELSHLNLLTDYEKHKLFARLSLLLWIDRDNALGISFSERLVELLRLLPVSDSITYHSMGFTNEMRETNIWQNLSSQI